MLNRLVEKPSCHCLVLPCHRSLHLRCSLLASSPMGLQGSLHCVGRLVFLKETAQPCLTWVLAAAAAEITGKMLFSQGLASSFRPRRYYTIPRETLEASTEDLEQLINFFVIEFQRVIFAENVLHTVAVSFPHCIKPLPVIIANLCSRPSLLPSSRTGSSSFSHCGAYHLSASQSCTWLL